MRGAPIAARIDVKRARLDNVRGWASFSARNGAQSTWRTRMNLARLISAGLGFSVLLATGCASDEDVVFGSSSATGATTGMGGAGAAGSGTTGSGGAGTTTTSTGTGPGGA